jgi:hypothetical protein
MVEAAGVEPASESTSPPDSTCVAALEISRPSSKSDGNRGAPAPKSLTVHGPARPVTASLLNDAQLQPAGWKE